MLVLGDAPLANSDEVARTAQHARCRSAHLHMRLAADRRELEHRIKRRDFETTNMGHAEKIADDADRRFRKPAAGLLLSAPQKRNNGGGLLARRILGDRRSRPGKIFRRESKAAEADRDKVGERPSTAPRNVSRVAANQKAATSAPYAHANSARGI